MFDAASGNCEGAEECSEMGGKVVKAASVILELIMFEVGIAQASTAHRMNAQMKIAANSGEGLLRDSLT